MIKVALIVVQGKPEGKTIPLPGPVFRIGRDPTCHLRPSNEMVSRVHSEIQVTDTEVLLKDMGSRNGTQLNGRTITQPVPLKSGDLIKVGPLTFAVSIQGAPAAGRSGPGPRSLDEVPQEEVEAWLIADNERAVPDRPSGVYDGETITIASYKDSAQKSGSSDSIKPSSSPKVPAAAKPAPTPPAAKPAPAPAPTPPAARPAPAPAPEPAPAVVQAPAPPPPAPAPVPAPAPAPAVVPEVAAHIAEPSTNVGRGKDNRRSFLEEIDNIEFLPEGSPEVEAPVAAAVETEGGAAQATAETDADTEAVDDTPEEFIDESNPFYQGKKKGQPEAEEKAKESFKDSSDAANAILKKMLERRRQR